MGALTAFITQALIGLFISNRSINGMALLTFMFLSSMVLGHVLLLRSNLIKKIKSMPFYKILNSFKQAINTKMNMH